MTAADCAICGRPTPDQAYICWPCTDSARRNLDTITALCDDARAVARGEIRRGPAVAGGKPGSRPPLNPGATDTMHAIQDTLTTLAREIADTRGVRYP